MYMLLSSSIEEQTYNVENMIDIMGEYLYTGPVFALAFGFICVLACGALVYYILVDYSKFSNVVLSLCVADVCGYIVLKENAVWVLALVSTMFCMSLLVMSVLLMILSPTLMRLHKGTREYNFVKSLMCLCVCRFKAEFIGDALIKYTMPNWAEYRKSNARKNELTFKEYLNNCSMLGKAYTSWEER